MKLWKRVFISIILVFISLATLLLIKFLEIPQATVGYSVLFTGSVVSLVVVLGIILITLTQFFPKKAEEKKKEEQRKFEEEFTKQLLEVESIDETKLVVDRYKGKSTLAHALSNPKIDAVALAQKIINTYSQKKVRDTVDYLIKIGKGYQVLGVIIKHLIAHKKIHDYQAYILEKEIGYLMPKRDIIGLYEKT